MRVPVLYFPAIKKAIQNLEEKKFYSVALMYLEQLGYKELSIVDGTGDGGRDVTCSRDDLRIQLSVRKDWKKKINEEAAKTKDAGQRHLIYVTNRIINPTDEQEFFARVYACKGEVEVSIADLRRVSTVLTRPGVINRSYELLGMAVPDEVDADPKEIAVSSVLMFSAEARELREEIIEANVRAQLLRQPGMSEKAVKDALIDILPGPNIERDASAALSRLRMAKRISGPVSAVDLAPEVREMMEAAETELLVARKADVARLVEVTGLNPDDADKLLDIALELLIRGRDLNGAGPAEEQLRNFLASHRLSRQRAKIYDALAATSSARIRQYGQTLDRIFSTNSFDIYRALGRRTNVQLVLDASVAMPVLFGLSFGTSRSRYGVSALALRDACKAHGISMVVPNAYLNEMASHGLLGVLDRLEIYNALSMEARDYLKASGNAYLSHFVHISETLKAQGKDLTLKEFLDYFGVVAGRPLHKVENRIRSLLEDFGIKVIEEGRCEQPVFNRIAEEKPAEPKILIKHDAAVVTMLKNDNNKGFVFATWDKTIIDLVQDLTRVYADTPARVVDFLSMAGGQDFEREESFELLSTLLHIDEKPAERLASLIDKIASVDMAYELNRIITEARAQKGKSWSLTPADVAPLIDQDAEQEQEV